MNHPPLLLLLLLLHSGLAHFLPAPVNLSVKSVNFHHVLHWQPGPGTPPGTRYMIYQIVSPKRRPRWLANSTTTSVQVKLKNPEDRYTLTVRASYNQTLSEASRPYRFAPYEQTVIDPPTVSLAGCENCIHVRISLPAADNSSGVDDIYKFYRPTYRAVFKEHGGKELSYRTENQNFTLPNLRDGTEYCVQVHTIARQNQNIGPSRWTCAYTSVAEPSRGPLVVGTVAVLLILVMGGLTASTLCLCYTGFICKLKATLPRSLMEVLRRGHFLTPERTIPDLVSVSTERRKQRKHTNPTAPRSATWGADSESDDEEEEGINVYLNKAGEFSSGGRSSQDSGGVSRVRTPAGAGRSGPECEATHEGAEVPFIPEEGQTGVRGDATRTVAEEQEEVCDSLDDVDLFSVTLATLAVGEEEEHRPGDSLTDCLLPTETESHDQTAGGEDADASSDCLRACEEEVEEEEEEESSGYIRHQ